MNSDNLPGVRADASLGPRLTLSAQEQPLIGRSLRSGSTKKLGLPNLELTDVAKSLIERSRNGSRRDQGEGVGRGTPCECRCTVQGLDRHVIVSFRYVRGLCRVVFVYL